LGAVPLMPIVGQFGSLAGLGSMILPGGAMESIATVTVGSGGASSIEFTNIGSGWQHLQIRMVARSTRSSILDYTRVQFNADTASNYAFHDLYGENVAGVGGYAEINVASMAGGGLTATTVNSSMFAAQIIDILDYSVTTKNKVLRCFSGLDTNASGAGGQTDSQVVLRSGLWRSTNAITSVKLFPNTGPNFAQHTTAALYGLRAP